jgi:hypothetical protein
VRTRGIKLGLRTWEQGNKLLEQLPSSDREEIQTIEQDIASFSNKIQKLWEARKQMSRNIKYKQELLKRHHELRQLSLGDNEEHLLQEGNATAATRAKCIAEKEQSRHNWKLIRQAMKPGQRSGLSTLEVTDRDETGR